MAGKPVHHTKGIVIRSVKYGETSLIVTMLTELFGLQSYIVNGVRTSTKRGSGQANLFQPAALLDMQVYHNEQKHLQRIREFKWACMYSSIYRNVIKNSVVLFMVELLQKTIRQPEAHGELFPFVEDALMHLDGADEKVTANFPLFFITQLTHFSGFRISDGYSPNNSFLDLKEGAFVAELPPHPYSLGEPYTSVVSHLLKVMHPEELGEIALNQELRKRILASFITFYSLHIPEFGNIRTLEVLQEVIR
jgi:DNA repair protein RecO (recombination protein O)